MDPNDPILYDAIKKKNEDNERTGRDIKRLIIGILVAMFLFIGIWTGIRRFTSYIIGVYTELPQDVNFMREYVTVTKMMRDDIENMSFEKFKKREKEKLVYETRFVEAGKSFVDRLKKEKQIK